jgi:short-subunit dehydrogenase
MSYALVTGAASGIGKAIAEELVQRGYGLLLVDIDERGLLITKADLSSRYTPAIHALHIDLSEPGIGETLLEWSKPFHKELNVIVSNAGYGLNGPFEKIPIHEQLNIIDTNIRSQLEIAYAFIPLLKQFDKAYLLNTGSTTCYQSVPYMAIYAASKAFVLSFTRSLRFELRDTSVSVSCLSPGSTDTNFVHRARMGENVKKMAQRYNMTPQSVAKTAIRGLFKGKAEIIPGFLNKLNAFLPGFFPKSLAEKIAGNIYRPKPGNTVNKQVKIQKNPVTF